MSSGGRDGRGASYMDQYDAQNDDNTYAGAKNSSDSSDGCEKCSKHTLFGVNFIMLLIGVALIVVVFFVKENGGSEDIPIGITGIVLWCTVGAGALIIILSFLGCVGAKTESKCVLVVFIIMLVICLLLEITAIVVIFVAKDIMKDQAETQWDELPTDKQAEYELEHDCQGFDACYTIIEDSLKDNMMLVGGITIAVSIYQLIMTVFACCLCTRLGNRGNSGSVDHYEV